MSPSPETTVKAADPTGNQSNPLGIHVFADFDGTISLADTGTILIDHCVGKETRRQMDLEVLAGARTFRSLCEDLWTRVNLTQSQVDDLLNDVQLDSHFTACVDYCQQRTIPVTVVSCGVESVIKSFLYRDLGQQSERIDILANRADVSADGWKFHFRDDTVHGHDKAIAIREARNAATAAGRPFYAIFLGDGISDLSAAMEADLLLARAGRDLVTYCQREGIEHHAFTTFESVMDAVERLHSSSRSERSEGK